MPMGCRRCRGGKRISSDHRQSGKLSRLPKHRQCNPNRITHLHRTQLESPNRNRNTLVRHQFATALSTPPGSAVFHFFQSLHSVSPLQASRSRSHSQSPLQGRHFCRPSGRCMASPLQNSLQRKRATSIQSRQSLTFLRIRRPGQMKLETARTQAKPCKTCARAN